MRKNNAKQSFRNLRSRLKTITSSDKLGLVEKFSQCLSLINDFLLEVRLEVTSVAFKDKMEEIYFFKFEKPEYYALKIYHVSLFTLLHQKPVGTDDQLREFYLEELHFIGRFFRQHAFHYQYYRAGYTEMDDTLFLRGVETKPFYLSEIPELDPDFSTNGDYLFAQFIAYELLQEYILEAIKSLDNEVTGNVTLPLNRGKKWFDWTGEIVNLVELGYAIYLSKQVNDEKASLADIFRWLEESFGVEIGIPANRFREIKRRKRLSRTHFLEIMQRAMISYMEEDDHI
ncbi:RteC domain-containing protein [Pedobacter sp. Hv1]|uniref:RteC domain-containing protein n=1 Tax=Pedobacter sp. Hv1 TaxID=1740090 RepID=UPI0006D8C95A|nr:RteC domain-containing protein [Pedobacter sp. Hv1]KQC02041.1 hypothetical protein AQF98_00260 [Pedobacter sp. Hv1]